MDIGPLSTDAINNLVERIRELQRQIIAASLHGDQSEVDRLAVLLRAEVRRVMGVSDWIAGVLVAGWVAELPTRPGHGSEGTTQ